ncbi:MAG: permease [Planctomycetaceae bacterium]|nr:permease [Planctomycetaceae bacterium]
MDHFMTLYSDAAKTSVGFFWKAAWAFVVGYSISAMIQAFVPKQRLTKRMGEAGLKSVSLATLFGTISSSCSFAALATARSLVLKGAHFITAVAFMFASTNLVIELGIMILVFLGWQFLAAEIIGGLLLIAISSILIQMTYPKRWIDAAREKVQQESESEEEDFDWRKRIRSLDGWAMVGHRFVMEWKMVWQEIVVGFTIAGVIATFVPDWFWKTLFLADQAKAHPSNFLIALENAVVAPFVAACTFIGSMGNIPLATVLNSGGVLFAGIMGFIYSDLMVPPLVKVNAKYYGWRVALYVAVVMFVSIVLTALILHYAFYFTGMMPESARQVEEVTQFKVDYTLFLNVAAIVIVGAMNWLSRRHARGMSGGHHDHGDKKWSLQDIVTSAAIVWVVGGLLLFASYQLGG